LAFEVARGSVDQAMRAIETTTGQVAQASGGGVPVIPIPPIAYIVVSAERFAFLEYC
jgi:hypothetical protein